MQQDLENQHQKQVEQEAEKAHEATVTTPKPAGETKHDGENVDADTRRDADPNAGIGDGRRLTAVSSAELEPADTVGVGQEGEEAAQPAPDWTLGHGSGFGGGETREYKSRLVIKHSLQRLNVKRQMLVVEQLVLD